MQQNGSLFFVCALLGSINTTPRSLRLIFDGDLEQDNRRPHIPPALILTVFHLLADRAVNEWLVHNSEEWSPKSSICSHIESREKIRNSVEGKKKKKQRNVDAVHK